MGKSSKSASTPKSSKKAPKTPKSSKKDVSPTEDAVDSGDSKAASFCCAIARPLAGKKLEKKLYKAIQKAASGKALKRGVKEVVKGIRKGDNGLVVIAADVSPVDVISHIPVFLEERGIPYVFVASKRDLGAAGNTKRPTSVVLISTKTDFEYRSKTESVIEEVKALTPTV